jgi:hypothetical protein
MTANLGHDGGSEGNVGHEVAVPGEPISIDTSQSKDLGWGKAEASSGVLSSSVHDVDVQPVGALVHGAGTFLAELGEVG